MENSIFRYILRYSLKQQIVLTIMAMVSFPFLYAFYELPKAIVNDAIEGNAADFPVSLLGFEFDQVAYLMVLSGGFVSLVIINQSFKYVINVYRGLTGERMLRRMRYELYGRILRFPLPVFRKVSQGEIIPMITSEVEPLGGFIGDAFSLPAFQGGTLLVILGFLFAQNPVMAAAAVSLYPIQVYVIPRLQRRVNLLGKERVRLVRRLSDRIGETVQGVGEIHVHDTSNYELAVFSRHLGKIFDVRYKIYRKKFVIKFLNNFIQQLGPFFFYAIGGYLVIRGQLDIGTLMAAIAAHKDLASPWKELLSYYQSQADARIKYEQVVAQFAPPNIRDESLQREEPEQIPVLRGKIVATNLVLIDDQDSPIIDGLNLSLPLDKRTAVVGGAGSGKEHLSLLLARLLDPVRGRITIGGVDLGTAPEAITGRRISFAGPSPHIFATTLGDNLFYGLKHRPLVPRDYDKDEVAAAERRHYVREAERSGNSTDDSEADWTDYAAAGASDIVELKRVGLKALRMVALYDDVFELGLRGTIDPRRDPKTAEAILQARTALTERLKDPSLSLLVERFDKSKFNSNASVAENLLFGTPVSEEFNLERLAENDYVLKVLDEVGLTGPLLSVGYQVAATMIELFAGLPPDHEFFEQFAFISSDDLPEFQALLSRADKDRLGDLKPGDRAMLLSLPFKLVPARHRLGLIDEAMRARILEARAAFAAGLPNRLRNAVAFFDAGTYNAAANIQDNILFGKVAYGQAHAVEHVSALIRETIQDLGLREVVTEAGFGFHVGIAGSRLSTAQRQKLGIARALIKRPDLLIMAEPTAALDSASQATIMRSVLEEFAGGGIVWTLHRASLAGSFDYVLVMKGGRIVEQGTYDDLNREDSHLRELIAAE